MLLLLGSVFFWIEFAIHNRYTGLLTSFVEDEAIFVPTDSDPRNDPHAI